MPDRPTDPSADRSADAPEQPARSLSEILEELAVISHAQQGEASEMRSAVSELSRSLARLFEMIRTDRHDQRARIAQLERELTAARDQLAALGVEPVVPPAPNDFDQLRAAAERLRVRTEQLVRDSMVQEPADAPEVVSPEPAPPGLAGEEPAAEEPVAEAPPTEVEAPGVEESETVEEQAAEEPPVPLDELPPAPVLRVLDGAVASLPTPPSDLDVESDLPLARAEAAAVAAPEPEPAPHPEPEPEPQAGLAPEPESVASAHAPRPEPISIAPRPARKRKLRPRRRRIDARKLADVESASALGSMVGAIDQLWTAGCPIDLVVAFTDGGALRVAGGDRAPLRVDEVEPGTRARCTITATRRQLIPLFGRLELTDDESAPLIHGSRRDADLLVGWFDRAQRLPVEPL